jgi:hypothetical protein
MTETLIETMLPTIAGALAKSQAPQPVAQQPRRAVSGNGLPPQRIARPQPQTLPKANIKPQEKTVQSGREVTRQNGQVAQTVKKESITGLPKANFQINKPIPQNVQTAKNVSVQWKKGITDLLVPVYTENLLEQTEPVKVAPKILNKLAQNGVGREEFLEKVTSSDILDVVKGFELPEIAYPWFEEIYAHIKDGTYNAIGEHTQNV